MISAQFAIAALQFALKVMDDLPAIKAAAETEDAEQLDQLHQEFSARSNAVADRLRAIPGD